MGIASIKENKSMNILVIKDNCQIGNITEKVSAKPKINFAYSLTIGASRKITDNAHLELAYSWKDYGKTHPKLDEDGECTHDKAHYRGHHVGIGLRFDI